MTRQAARRGFDTFLERTIDLTRREFSVARALGDANPGLGIGGTAIDRLRRHADAVERRVVKPELETYRRRSMSQFDVVLDYAESDGPIDAFADDLLAQDSYVEAFDPGLSEAHRRRIEADILDRLEMLGDGIEPIVDHPTDEFWPAVVGGLEPPAARTLIEDSFPFTEPIEANPQAFVFEVRVDPGAILGGPFARGLPSVSLEYTAEARRAMRRAEQRVIREALEEVDRRFEGST